MPSSRSRKRRPVAAPVEIPALSPRASSRIPAVFQLDRAEWRILGLILVLTFAAFANSLRGQFVYDDLSQVMANATLKSLANIPAMFVQSVWQFMNEGTRQPLGSYYRPLFNVALILNYQLFGFAVVGWHVVCVLLHLAATFFVYLLCRQWGMRRETGLAAALLFGVHPAHSESVAWVSALPDPMAAVFLLPALLLYEQHRQRPAGGGRSLLLGSLGLTVLALLSKEVAVVFPLFLLLREWLDRPQREPFTRTISKNGIPFYLALAVLYLVLRYSVLGFLSQAEPRAAGIANTHVWLTLPSALAGYARILLFPYPLAVVYDWPSYVTSVRDPRFWGLGAVTAAVVIGATRLVRSSAVGRNALLFLILFLLPVLNLKFFNPYEALLHDRYLYLPSVGFCVLMALGLGRLHALCRWSPRLLWLGPAVVALVYFVLTVRQNRFWRDDYVMTQQALRVAPRNVFFLDYRGSHFFKQGKWPEAERYYRRALELGPTYYPSFVNLGEVYSVQKRYVEAEQAYRRALELGAPLDYVHASLGETYALQDRFAEAEAELSQAIRMAPKDLDSRYNLAWVYDRQGKAAQAESAYLQILRADPSHVDARVNLGALLSRQGRYDAAVEQLQTALRGAPNNTVLLYELAVAYERSGRCPQAIEVLHRLAELEPSHPRAYTDLGLCYEAMGNPAEAGRQFRKALEIAPHDPHTDLARQRLARAP